MTFFYLLFSITIYIVLLCFPSILLSAFLISYGTLTASNKHFLCIMLLSFNPYRYCCIPRILLAYLGP
jgi:hypothetical protein